MLSKVLLVVHIVYGIHVWSFAGSPRGRVRSKAVRVGLQCAPGRRRRMCAMAMQAHADRLFSARDRLSYLIKDLEILALHGVKLTLVRGVFRTILYCVRVLLVLATQPVSRSQCTPLCNRLRHIPPWRTPPRPPWFARMVSTSSSSISQFAPADILYQARTGTRLSPASYPLPPLPSPRTQAPPTRNAWPKPHP